jgi:hypothetical protein
MLSHGVNKGFFDEHCPACAAWAGAEDRGNHALSSREPTHLEDMEGAVG